jgi:hypothetical protein
MKLRNKRRGAALSTARTSHEYKHHAKVMSEAQGEKENRGMVKRGGRVGRRWTPEKL